MQRPREPITSPKPLTFPFCDISGKLILLLGSHAAVSKLSLPVILFLLWSCSTSRSRNVRFMWRTHPQRNRSKGRIVLHALRCHRLHPPFCGLYLRGNCATVARGVTPERCREFTSMVRSPSTRRLARVFHWLDQQLPALPQSTVTHELSVAPHRDLALHTRMRHLAGRG